LIAAGACGSDGQALAAFGAACVDHGTATAALHPNQETVGAGAANFRSLISAFHDLSNQYLFKEIACNAALHEVHQ
jgi:hypothetical protein